MVILELLNVNIGFVNCIIMGIRWLCVCVCVVVFSWIWGFLVFMRVDEKI